MHWPVAYVPSSNSCYKPDLSPRLTVSGRHCFGVDPSGIRQGATTTQCCFPQTHYATNAIKHMHYYNLKKRHIRTTRYVQGN